MSQGEDPTTRVLDRKRVFDLVCQEVFRDGRADPEEKALLKRLQKLLRIRPDQARAAYDRAKSAHRSGGLEEGGPLDPAETFHRACEAAWEDSALEKTELALLTALASALGLGAGVAREILDEVSRTSCHAPPQEVPTEHPANTSGGANSPPPPRPRGSALRGEDCSGRTPEASRPEPKLHASPSGNVPPVPLADAPDPRVAGSQILLGGLCLVGWIRRGLMEPASEQLFHSGFQIPAYFLFATLLFRGVLQLSTLAGAPGRRLRALGPTFLLAVTLGGGGALGVGLHLARNNRSDDFLYEWARSQRSESAFEEYQRRGGTRHLSRMKSEDLPRLQFELALESGRAAALHEFRATSVHEGYRARAGEALSRLGREALESFRARSKDFPVSPAWTSLDEIASHLARTPDQRVALHVLRPDVSLLERASQTADSSTGDLGSSGQGTRSSLRTLLLSGHQDLRIEMVRERALGYLHEGNLDRHRPRFLQGMEGFLEALGLHGVIGLKLAPPTDAPPLPSPGRPAILLTSRFVPSGVHPFQNVGSSSFGGRTDHHFLGLDLSAEVIFLGPSGSRSSLPVYLPCASKVTVRYRNYMGPGGSPHPPRVYRIWIDETLAQLSGALLESLQDARK